jgi:hypothetical protein
VRSRLARLAPIGLVAVGAGAATAVWLIGRGADAPTAARIVGADAPAPAPVPADPANPAPATRPPITGRVTLDGAPVTATVVLSSDRTEAGAEAERRIETGPTGAFTIADPGAGDWQVTALAPGTTAATATITGGVRDLTLALGRCRFEIYGAITDSGGAPVAHASIGLAGARALITTDRDGRYRACVPGGVQRVEVRAPDKGAVIRAIAIDGATRVDMALAPEARILGRVTDATGAGAAGALVTARGALDDDHTDLAGTARAVAGPDGAFELRGVGAGAIELGAAQPGAIAAAAPTLAITAGSRSTIALELAAPIAATGTLTAGAAPVARTPIHWRSRAGVEVTAITDAAGRFTLAAPPGPARITVAGRTVITGGAPDAPAADLAIALAPASIVRGRVFANSQPVAGALIAARGPGYAATTSAADGQFALALEAAGRWQIGASSDELGAAARAIPVTIVRGQDRELGAIDLAWAGSIAGKVVDERGEPVVGAMVLAQNLDENDFGRSVTGPDGAFRCDQLSGGDGAYDLRVVASDTSDAPLALANSAPANSAPAPRIELGKGDRHVTGVALTVVAPHATVHGTVVDGAGAPRPGTIVRIAGWASASATADDDGAFALEVAGAGPYDLAATAPDGSVARAASVTPAAPVRIVLAAAASLHVTATGFASAPTITLRRLGGSDFATGTGATLDAAALGPGTYVVQASAGATSDVRTITIADGQHAAVALAARAVAHVTGRVVARPDGAGAADFDCVAAPMIGGIAGFGDAGAVRTDAQGAFTLAVPAGDSEVRCWRLDGSASDASRMVHTDPGGTAAIELPVVRAVDGSARAVSFEVAPAGARITKVPRSVAGLAVGDLVTRADGIDLAGLSRTGLGFAAFTARSAPATWTVVRGARTFTVLVP